MNPHAPAERDQLEALQERLARRVDIAPRGGALLPTGLVLLALDVQYESDVAFVAGSLHTSDGAPLGGAVAREKVETPYRAGYFCFREGPPLLALVKAIRQSRTDIAALLVDGHGIAHPRRFGVASWLGLATRLPTVGCAKETLLRYEGTLPPKRGSTLKIEREQEAVGYVLRSQSEINPVFVSPGHGCSLVEARDLVLQVRGDYRVPEPIRQADQAARRHARGEPPADGWQDLGELTALEPEWD